jgi:ketol-acid reductoisomerase
MLEIKVNQTSFKATRAKLAEHSIEQVGAKLRAMMVDQTACAGRLQQELGYRAWSLPAHSGSRLK